MLIGELVWHEANRPVLCHVPFRLVCHKYVCSNCNTASAHAPVAWLLHHAVHALQRPVGIWTEDLPPRLRTRPWQTIRLEQAGGRPNWTEHALHSSVLAPAAATWSGYLPSPRHACSLAWARRRRRVGITGFPEARRAVMTEAGSWGPRLPELSPWTEPTPDIPAWQTARDPPNSLWNDSDTGSGLRPKFTGSLTRRSEAMTTGTNYLVRAGIGNQPWTLSAKPGSGSCGEPPRPPWDRRKRRNPGWTSRSLL